MAVALRELERRYDGRRPGLRAVPTPAAPPRPPRRVFWLRRLLVLAVASALVIAGVAATRALTGGDVAVARMDVAVVIPESGTLWDLAERYAPAGVDRALWVAEVAERNAVDPAAMRPGTVVSLPVAAPQVIAAPRSTGQP
jgi:nucleoid-associated protein YgaU